MGFVVQFTDIVKRYGEFAAVRGVTLDIPAGGIFACLGLTAPAKPLS